MGKIGQAGILLGFYHFIILLTFQIFKPPLGWFLCREAYSLETFQSYFSSHLLLSQCITISLVLVMFHLLLFIIIYHFNCCVLTLTSGILDQSVYLMITVKMISYIL